MNNWINVNDRLPNEGLSIMIYSESAGVAEGEYKGDLLAPGKSWVQYRWSAIKTDVTHWQPLIEKPTKEAEQKSDGMMSNIIESQSLSIKEMKKEISGLKETVESYGKIIDSL